MLEVLDFLERLAPFSDPAMVLKDARPMMTAELAQRETNLKEEQTYDSGESTATGQSFDALQLLRNSLAQ